MLKSRSHQIICLGILSLILTATDLFLLFVTSREEIGFLLLILRPIELDELGIKQSRRRALPAHR